MAEGAARPGARRPARRGVHAGDVVGLLLLAAIFALFVARSWLAWGDLDADYGRELFVPLRLSQGDVIYRDVRYPYGPLVPYLHALLYHMWQPHLAVLYASGLCATALVVVALFVFSRQLCSPFVATLATALALVDLMFIPGSIGSFSYVFPYAFPTLYGLLFALIAMSGALHLLAAGGSGTAIAAGCAIGLALLTKQEFGVLALGAGAGALLGQALLRRPRVARTGVALALPAIAIPLVGYGALAQTMPVADILTRGLASQYLGWPLTWMIAGFEPGSSFAQMGARLSSRIWESARWYPVPVALIAAAGFLPWPRTPDAPRTRVLSLVTIVVAVSVLAAAAALLLRAIAPIFTGAAKIPAIVETRYGALPALLALWLFVESVGIAQRLLRGAPVVGESLQRWLAVAFALALLTRVVAALVPLNFANFYLGPSIVLLCLGLAEILPAVVARAGGSESSARLAAACVIGLLTISIGVIRFQRWGLRTVELATPRGTFYLSQQDNRSEAYRRALDLILAQTQPGDTILAVPTEPSFYFLTGRGNRLYETALVASLTTEDEERAYIQALAADPPVLILISNRIQPEYGRFLFGKDYNRLVHGWITENYVAGDVLGRGFRIQAWHPRDARRERAESDRPTPESSTSAP